jgi:O-antigen/teichoic acid export membrane protein
MKTTKEAPEYYSIKRLKRNALVFAGGKTLNSILSISIFALIASGLSKSDFAIWAWLLAFLHLSANLSRFGVNWAVDRYVPELRSTMNSIVLKRFILVMTGLRVMTLILFAFVFYWSGQALLSFFGKEDWLPAFQLYALLIIPFALNNFLRDTVFQALLKQAHSQANTTIRHLVLLSIVLFYLFWMGSLELNNVIYGEIAASVAAVAVALVQLGYLLRQLPYGEQPTTENLPAWRSIAKFAANSYANEVLRMSGSGLAVMTAAPQVLTTVALAPYGFCQTLFSQLQRFLPAHLFSGLYRPRMIAQYTKTQDFKHLNQQLILILKISNYVLLGGLSVFLVYGEVIFDLLSGGRYADAHRLMLMFIVLMMIENFRQIMMTLCATIERVDFLSRASLFMPLVVPVALGLAILGAGPVGLAAAMIAADVCSIAMIVYQLKRAGYDLSFDVAGQARIAAACVVAALIGTLIHGLLPDGLPFDLAGMVLVGLTFLAVSRVLRPMGERERMSIDRMIGRRAYLF